MTSISSQMISSITEFRNANPNYNAKKSEDPTLKRKNFKILVAQAGYIFSFAFSVIETVAKAKLLLLSTLASPITTAPTKQAWKELKSSAFSIVWALKNIFVNPFCANLPTSEERAFDSLKKGPKCIEEKPKEAKGKEPVADAKEAKEETLTAKVPNSKENHEEEKKAS